MTEMSQRKKNRLTFLLQNFDAFLFSLLPFLCRLSTAIKEINLQEMRLWLPNQGWTVLTRQRKNETVVLLRTIALL